MNIRTRFAPSPTGYLHVGGIRTALFAWLVARQASGQFVLRLEDTDKKREVVGADTHLMESLQVVGLAYDEGPDIGGPYAPYRQSERLDSYNRWAQKLISRGRAYADPYTAEEVQAFREQAVKEKRPFLYRHHRPAHPPVWDGTKPLRFKSEPKAYQWDDVVMGPLSTAGTVIDDFVLLKADGYPTYNFSHIIDDEEMKISHVIRGQEFLASMPNYLNLYDALEIQRPVFATLPHILGHDGTKKLSKRDGAKDVLDYVRAGFLPEALINFIAMLGWNDGTQQEVFSVDELIEKFSLDRVGRSGARFDEQRLKWINGAHIRQLSLDVLYSKVGEFWPKEVQSYDDDYKKRVLLLIQERLKYFAEIPELTRFFFVDLPVSPELISSHKQLKQLGSEEIKNLLAQAIDTLQAGDFSIENLTLKLNELLQQTGQKPAILFSLIRIATTQAPASPGLAETLNVLGKDVSLRRMDATLASL